MTEAEIRDVYNQSLLSWPDIPRWGSFDRPLVGTLLDEISRLREANRNLEIRLENLRDTLEEVRVHGW